MNWNFIKTNWFYLAMGIVLLMYAGRKYPGFNPFNPSNKVIGSEKTTGKKAGSKGGAALLGFVPDGPRESLIDKEAVSETQTETFLKRFAQVAVSERKKFGIPTSVILACAYSNSLAGQQEFATAANNFFALPCSEDWEGETTTVDGKCARKYESAWASFRDFSIYLSSQEWFGTLKKTAGKDWHKWVEKLDAEGLSKAKTMRKVIEAYHLDELDQ